MESRWDHFTVEELTCRCGCGQMLMNDMFMDRLVMMRKCLKFPLPVPSGYRCPLHNESVSTTGANGPHTTGRAVDILIYGERAFKLVDIAFSFGFTGIGVKQAGDLSERIIHLDDLDIPNLRPWIWSY